MHLQTGSYDVSILQIWEDSKFNPKITLVGLGSGAEISEQYGSKLQNFKFEIASKCSESVRFARATHHSIRNIPKFPTHTRMLSSELKRIFYFRKTVPPYLPVLDRASLNMKFSKIQKIQNFWQRIWAESSFSQWTQWSVTESRLSWKESSGVNWWRTQILIFQQDLYFFVRGI